MLTDPVGVKNNIICSNFIFLSAAWELKVWYVRIGPPVEFILQTNKEQHINRVTVA